MYGHDVDHADVKTDCKRHHFIKHRVSDASLVDTCVHTIRSNIDISRKSIVVPVFESFSFLLFFFFIAG